MTTFIFARHGKSQANADNLVTDSASPLTKEGESQARKLGRDLRGKNISLIVSSPYDRARRTAEIIAKELKITHTVEVIDDLRERGFGELEGREKKEDSAWYANADGEHDMEPRGFVIARAEAALSAIKKCAVAQGEGKVLVIGHAVAGYFLQQVAAGKRYFEEFAPYKHQSNAHVTEVTINPVTSKPIQVKPKLLLSFIAMVVGLALFVTGVILLMQREAPQPQKTSPDIILQPEDYNGDPALQNAINQQLQQQSGSSQSSQGDLNTLQPVTKGIPGE